MSGRLAGKVAVVIGAGSRGAGIGNGKAAAILFAREGAAVVCADQIVARADETVAAIVAEGGTASSLACDVSHREGCQQLAAAAVERYGRIDILQNNVGIASDQSLEDITEEAWDHVMGVNVRSMALAAQAVVPHMVTAGSGSIINLSSIAGLRAYPADHTAYTTTKAAIIGLTLTLAGQLAASTSASTVLRRARCTRRWSPRGLTLRVVSVGQRPASSRRRATLGTSPGRRSILLAMRPAG